MPRSITPVVIVGDRCTDYWFNRSQVLYCVYKSCVTRNAVIDTYF